VEARGRVPRWKHLGAVKVKEGTTAAAKGNLSTRGTDSLDAQTLEAAADADRWSPA
jgi:hypothetical protein